MRSMLLMLVKGLWSLFVAMWVSVPFALKLLMVVMMAKSVSAVFDPKASLSRTLKEGGLALGLAGFVHYTYMSIQHNTSINLGFDVASAVALFYSTSAGVEILIHLHAAGLKIPPVLITYMLKAQGMSYEDRQALEQFERDGRTLAAKSKQKAKDQRAG